MLIWVYSFLACQSDSKPQVTYVEELDGSVEAGVELVSSVRTDTAMARARVVNTYGAAIATEQDITFYVSTLTDPITSSVDGFGFAAIHLDPDLYEELTPNIKAHHFSLNETDDKTNFAYTISETPDFVVPISTPLAVESPNFAALGTNGYILAKENIIYWQDASRSASYFSALTAPSNITGLWSAHIDTDGVLDAVVWSTTEVFLLRGHPDGGLSWGAGYSFPKGEVVNVAATDLDGDLVADIAIGLTLGKDGAVVILHGNGNWTFSERPPLELDYPLESISAADENQDGSPDITLIDGEAGYIRRYSYSDDGWIGGLPSLINPNAYIPQVGSYFPPMEDINVDGKLDVVLIGGTANNIQDLVFFVIDGDVTKYEQEYPPFIAGFADIDQNGSTDILALDDNNLHIVQYDNQKDPPTFTSKTINGFSQKTPFALTQLNGDDLLDLVIFDEYASAYHSKMNEQSGWILERPSWRKYATTFTHPFVSGNLDNDENSAEIIGFQNVNAQASLAAYRFVPPQDNPESDPTTLEKFANHQFGTASSQALDMAQCGTNIITLTAIDDGTHQIQIFNLINDELTATTPPRNIGQQQRVACRQIGSYLCIAVGAGDSEWLFLNASLETIESGQDNNWKDVAIGEIDGDGRADIRGCLGEGCSIAMADVDGNGIDELIVSGDEIIVVSNTDTDGDGQVDEISTTLDRTGSITIADINSDGIEDLLVRDSTTTEANTFIWVYQNIGGTLALPYALTLEEESIAFPQLIDINLDGQHEFIMQNANNEVMLSNISSNTTTDNESTEEN